MSSPFSQEDGPQPPKVLKAPVEIVANLRQLQQNHDPLIITFHERNQRFQSYVIEVDRDKNLLILDELVPNDGERYLANGEAFNVEAFHEGVRVAWKCEQNVRITEHEGARCYFSPMPLEVTYHQRRSAFRAPLKQTELIKVELAGDKLRTAIPGHLLDISATGCKLRFPGNISSSLQAGQVYERFTARFPFGAMTTAIEMRHVQYEEKVDTTFVGARFHRINGQEQRLVERFVYQLQREARRFESDGLF
ncbi:MAG: pilus assembly protein PilZ [Gammaproteobacteria bacterium HGW-Gammaproteobacteria-13]|uniref:flagellar brake protein n=1 Tax=unclassified Pseudomonas TaxID=196821 RepID=UPI000CAAF238|nr:MULTISPECIES: flagellar brake protein [unclassified Pseudomonas]MDF3194437.1 flagellar brake protein [Pseudomonas sp. 1928-m]MDP2746374.1 flagellar brake protein [Pseudomonas sp.]PKM23745.1 MAG: pilus assembly protein PilZ [Gammaproteobacteria bacterium HGW-Gammaproteobacteria-13]